MADAEYGSGDGGKRSAEDQRHNSNKRPRGDFNQVVFRLMIRSMHAGGVIGKGGENIKRLRSDYDAKVTIPDCNGPERIIKIVTKDLDSGLDCIKDIIPSIGEKKGPQDQGRNSKDQNSYIRIMVHQSHAGAIIGRGGFKIKDLREKTGAHFKVYTATCPRSTDRVVQLTGTPDVIVKAAREVYEVCTETAVKGPVQEYDPFCYPFGDYEKYGGYLFDPAEEYQGGGYGGDRGGDRSGGGGNWNRGPPMNRGGFDRSMGGGGNDNFGYGRSPYGGGRMGGGGGRMGGGGGMDMGGGRRGGGRGGGPGGRGSFGRDQQYGGQGGFGYGGDAGRGQSGYGSGGGGGGYDGGAGGGGGASGEAVQTQQVTIPTDLAGSIIGKGGQRIKRIRMESGAQIKIDDPLQGSKERIITITGYPP